MQLLERTQEYEPKYDLWPYKRRNTGGSITKNYSCVDLTMMHICKKFERNPSRNVACRAHTRFPPKYDIWPYKRRNTGGSITKNYRRVDFTKIHLHTKFERNTSRNAAVRAHTRLWRGGGGGGRRWRRNAAESKASSGSICRGIQLTATNQRIILEYGANRVIELSFQHFFVSAQVKKKITLIPYKLFIL